MIVHCDEFNERYWCESSALNKDNHSKSHLNSNSNSSLNYSASNGNKNVWTVQFIGRSINQPAIEFRCENKTIKINIGTFESSNSSDASDLSVQSNEDKNQEKNSNRRHLYHHLKNSNNCRCNNNQHTTTAIMIDRIVVIFKIIQVHIQVVIHIHQVII